MREKENPNDYAIITANVRHNKDLTANAKLLYEENILARFIRLERKSDEHERDIDEIKRQLEELKKRY